MVICSVLYMYASHYKAAVFRGYVEHKLLNAMEKLTKSIVTILVLFIGVFALTQFSKSNSLSLTEYADQHPELQTQEETETATEELSDTTETDAEPQETEAEPTSPVSTLMGATLNGEEMLEDRYTYADAFYYEPLSDNLRRYITGISYPATDAKEKTLAVSYDELRYLHILHYDFEGNIAEGELICNEYIAQDLVEIFHELYRNEYQLEKVHLIDEYDGDDTASMIDNNTSCFNYRVVEGTTSLSKHALGLALDINPFYNPYITYNEDGSENVSPEGALKYADRSVSFPYKIDENDLCYKLFTEHGFTWGGNWNSCKDYQHFQKAK